MRRRRHQRHALLLQRAQQVERVVDGVGAVVDAGQHVRVEVERHLGRILAANVTIRLRSAGW